MIGGMRNYPKETAEHLDLPEGVYVCMNGRAFLWDQVKKNNKTGYFESIH